MIAMGIGIHLVVSKNAEQVQMQDAAKKAQARIEFEARQREYCEAEKNLWVLASASQVEVRDLSLSPSTYGDDYSVPAAAKNNSTFKISTLQLSIIAA